jgi:hypothetical protein
MAKDSSPFEGMPLPMAALVIDTRGKTAGNYILNTLKYEIDTLCQEMRIERVNQWRFLTSIIDYLPLGTLSHSELQNYRDPHKTQSQSNTNGTAPTLTTPGPTAPGTNNRQYAKTIMGPVNTQTTAHHFFRGSPQRRSLDEIPEGNFKNNVRKILALCDNLRTKRVNATVDLDTQGSLGPTRSGEGMVRLIFITDAQSEDSLATAATYAAYLRQEMLFQNFYEEKLLLSTMIICLNHENRGEAPRMLIDALSWDDNISWPHIDSCIIVENYGEHGARLVDDVQEEHIEFLLYVLLITDPYQLRVDIHAPDVTSLMSESARWRMLPVEKCFSIGLSAFTYSVRWGRHLLNSNFTEHLAQLLTDRPQSLAGDGTRVMVGRWFDEQLVTTQGALPEQVAGDMPELNALVQAKVLIKPASGLFPSRRLSIHVGKDSLRTLDEYDNDLEGTYTASTPQYPSLQDAIGCEPTIPEYVSRWQGDAGSTLMKVLTNAHRVLADQRFFNKTSGKGAVSRARHQLQELAGIITERQKEHRGRSIDPATQRDALHKQYEREHQSLEELNKRFPLIGRKARGFLSVVTLILWLIAVLVVCLVGLAWLHRIVFLYAPPVLNLFDLNIFNLSFLNVFSVITAVLILGALTLTAFLGIRALFGKKVSALRIEAALLISLAIIALFGLIVSFLLPTLVGDSVSLGLLSWLSLLPYGSILALVIGLVIILVELSYFLKWHSDIVKERQRIVETLNQQHRSAIDDIQQYLAEAFLLSILQRAALIDETGTKQGRYYTAIEQLHTLLGTVQAQAEERYQMIQQHLERITENQTLGPASSKLYLREELLDVTMLNNRLVVLDAAMHAHPYFIELTELLLRSLGAEAPTVILRDMEQRPQEANNFLMDNYQYEAQLLLSLTVAEALDLSIEQLPSALPDTDLLESRYRALDYHYRYAVMHNLLDQMKSKVAIRMGKNKKQPQDKSDVELATAAIVAWAEVLWEHDEQLKEVLTQEGVLARMERQGYSPETTRTKFIIRVAPLNRSMHVGQQTDTYLITFPTNKGSKLLREMDIARITVNFPDEELLALLSLSHYVSMPYKIEEESVAQLGSGQADSTATAINIQQDAASNSQSVTADKNNPTP